MGGGADWNSYCRRKCFDVISESEGAQRLFGSRNDESRAQVQITTV